MGQFFLAISISNLASMEKKSIQSHPQRNYEKKCGVLLDPIKHISTIK